MVAGWRQRLVVVLAVAGAAAALLPGLGATPLVDWDESIYASVGRAVHEGSALHLEWNGDPYDRKPPLLFWAIAASYRLLGVSELATRLPSALAGIATVALVAGVVARRAGSVAALLSTSFLLGSTLFLERGGRRACTDALLVLFSVYAMAKATEPRRTRRDVGLAGVAVGLAILSKGAAGALVPLALLVSAPLDAARRRLALAVGGVG
ncbi:glycosyltransferase family 39 protein, partial [Candidatus Binatia bacterium]|nr:glycosyltransferase family 39 protein [Candidatus Binatia bacterium]